jgi:formamidopyrimidine-DNA glycosylase
MPEGPEILYTSIYLKKYLKNSQIETIKSFTDKPAIIPKDYIGIVEDIGCKGKLFWIKVTGKEKSYYIDIHYGITGWLQEKKPEKNIKFEFVIKNKNNDYKYLYMEDTRRFSKVQINTQAQHDKLVNKLGVDLLSSNFTLENFKKIIKSKSTILAALLLKQEIFCGIGNYIKNEAIHLTNLKIKVKTNELTDDQIVKLYNNILFISYSTLIELLEFKNLKNILNKEITDLIPKKIEVPYVFKVYSRETTIDGKKVYKIKVAGRDSYCIKENC